jgi:integrase
MSMKYLYWRGNALWSRFPHPNKPKGNRYSMGLKYGKGLTKAQCEKMALQNGYLPFIVEPNAKLFESDEVKEEHYYPTVNDLLDRYYDETLSFKKSHTQLNNQLKRLRDAFGDKKWDELNVVDITMWFSSMRKKGYEIETIKIWRQHIRSAYTHAFDEPDEKYRISSNPLTRLKKLTEQSNIRKNFVSEELFEKIIRFFSKRFPDFVPFYTALYLTGRRPEETALWSWEKIGEKKLQDGNTVHYIDIPSTNAKNKQEDRVYLPERLWNVIISQGWRTGYVFRNSLTGKNWYSSTWTYRINILKAQYPDIPQISNIVCRDTRRGFITRKKELEHKPLTIVQRLVGHSSSKSTERYCEAQLDEVIESVYPEHFTESSTERHSKVG